jgi:hypothetical protein
MSITVKEQSILRSLEARLATEQPELLELACFFDQVSGPLTMPRTERLLPGRRGLARPAAIMLLVFVLAGRVALRVAGLAAHAIAGVITWYGAALVVSQAPALGDARACTWPGRGSQGPEVPG